MREKKVLFIYATHSSHVFAKLQYKFANCIYSHLATSSHSKSESQVPSPPPHFIVAGVELFLGWKKNQKRKKKTKREPSCVDLWHLEGLFSKRIRAP